jgi:alpha-galactosidase
MAVRIQNLSFLFIPVFLASCSFGDRNFRIRSTEISMDFDRNSMNKIQWLPAGQNSIVAFDSAIQPGIVIDGETCIQFSKDLVFRLKKRTLDKEYGPAVESVVTGTFEKGDLKILRESHILLPEKFPNVVIFTTLYRNLGKKRIHIDSVFTQRILLSNNLADTTERKADFASFQGGINEWGRNYSLIWLTPGFRQENFQGMHRTNPTEVVGGGMPFVDVWGKTMGVAVAHLETKPQWLSLPVTVHPNGKSEISIVEKPAQSLGMKEWLDPLDSFQTVRNAVIFHHLDFYDALRTYGDLLRCRGIGILKTSPEKAYEPYWKSWGFGMNFTLDMIYNVLPELNKIGINTANLDDGWFDYYGDWNVNRSHGKFPNGEKDMMDFVRKIHSQGFKTNLWWYPLGVSPESKLAKERPDLLIQAEDGSFPLESRGLYQFCPAYEPSLKYIQDLVIRFTDHWGYDGLYSDTRGLAAVPPCYNKAHHHQSPLESFREVPQVLRIVYETLQKHSKDAFQEVCICATPHSPYNMPYYQIASASDPVNLLQVRRRIKVEKAIHGSTFCVGDCYQVPKDEWDGFSCRESFESALGTGAQVTTFYKDLDSAQFKEWKKWVGKYRKLGLSQAEYVNLYDIAFDKPEIHVVTKGDDRYYGIYADAWEKNKAIELRGLEKGVDYSVYDYNHDQELGRVNGSNPLLNIDFREYLLIRLTPVKSH